MTRRRRKPLSPARDLTTGQAARFMRMSIQSVIKALGLGVIDGYRLPGRSARRVTARSVSRWLRQQGEEPPAELLAAAGETVPTHETGETTP